MSPRSDAQWQEMREQSRENILSTALELFAEKGFHNTTIQQIAKQADIAKGLIYRYFESKEDLLKGIILSAFKEGDRFIEMANQMPNPKDQIRLLIESSFTYMQERPHHSRLLTQLSLQINQFPSIKEIILAKYHAIMPVLEALLREAGIENPKLEASLLTALLDGIGFRYLILGEVAELENMKKELIRKYCEHP